MEKLTYLSRNPIKILMLIINLITSLNHCFLSLLMYKSLYEHDLWEIWEDLIDRF